MKQRELELLLQQFIDGLLDDEACRELVALLKSDPDSFAIYCEYANLDANLRHLISGPAHLGADQTNLAELAREQGLKRTRRMAVLTAVAAVLMALAVLHIILVPDKRPVVTFRASPDTLFSVEHPSTGDGPPAPGSLAPGCRLKVRQGFVELNFASGVRSIVQAPADLTLVDENLLHVETGQAWFHVPPPAVGFQVETPTLIITDLGTEFGVISRPDADDEIHAFSGKVDARARSGATVRERLTAGLARAVTSSGELSTIPPREDRFLRALPLAPPLHLHWSFDEGDPGRQQVLDNRPASPGIESQCVSPDGTDPFASFSSVPGRFGNALCSFGRNGYVKTNWPGIDRDAPCTVAYWIKLPPGQHYVHSMVGWNPRTSTNSGTLFSSVRNTATGCVAGVTLGETDYDGSTPIDDGQWHHLAIVSTGPTPRGGPDFTCYVDGRRETMTLRRRGDGITAFPGETAAAEPVPLTLFARTWDHEELGQDITLVLVRENGTTSVYLNGMKIGTDTGFPPGLESLTTLTIGANRGGRGELEGFFTGTIDRVRLSTFTGTLGSSDLLGARPPDLTVVADYTFDDNQTPAGFREIGDPTYEDGRLVLDGDDALELDQTPLAATDNFVMEARVKMTRFPTNPGKFAFPVSNSNGMNRGWGLLYQCTWGGIIMSQSAVGSSSATYGQEVAVAIDELHVFEGILGANQILNLYRTNDIHHPMVGRPTIEQTR